MNDLDTAKNYLQEKELTLTIVKEGSVIFETASHKISGFLGAIEKLGDKLEGAAVADRVVGKAIAILCVYARIHQVYAEILSQKAKAVFEENGVSCEWKKLVDTILDLNQIGVCPFEKAAMDMSDPEKAYESLKALLYSFESGK